MFATLTLRALLPLGEPSPRIPPTSDVLGSNAYAPSLSPVGTLETFPSVESWSHASFSRARPTYAACLATRDSSNRCFRTRQKLRPRRLSTASSEKTHRPEPHLRHPRKGMSQPRPRTPSTVSTDRLLSPAVRSAVSSELNTTTLRASVCLRFCRGPRQRGDSTEPVTSVRFDSRRLATTCAPHA